MLSVLITGSAGLIGSEVTEYFHARGFMVHGIDNNQRAIFFGPSGDTKWNRNRLEKRMQNYKHYEVDIRDRHFLMDLVKQLRPDCIVHAAAQPSHDLAAKIPFDDFETNAVGTLNLLEAARQFCGDSPFIYFSTNKVYGDSPNKIRLKELASRWEFDDPAYENGIDETMSIDQTTHSLFGASKVAGDVLVQEYGRYFGLPTCCLRGGCLTGPSHSGVELHGFLSYLIKCNLEEREYNIFGYKGKQVRDNIHSADVASFVYAFFKKPRFGEVYNLGGGHNNSCSIIEAFSMVAEVTGKPQRFSYQDKNRIGDHICYYSDLRKIRLHYPEWDIKHSLRSIVEQTCLSWIERMHKDANAKAAC